MIKQKFDEFEKLLQLISSRNVKKTLEIGTFDGESAIAFAEWTQGEVITVDINFKSKLPHGIIKISGFSQSEKVVNEVSKFAPFDFIFIDGDHRRAKEDFLIYRNFLSSGGIFGFHDINPNCSFTTCAVVQVWDELKNLYPSEEIISETDLRSGYGIGLLFM